MIPFQISNRGGMGGAKMIQSEEDLKKTLLERSDSVVTLICDVPSDLGSLDKKLSHLQIDFVLYCPFDPYNHPYDVIDHFFDQVETEHKGGIS